MMYLDTDLSKSIFDNIDQGIYFVDIDRKITYWNKAAENISGYKNSDILGKHCSDNILYHVDDNGTKLCECSCPLSKTINDGKMRKNNIYLHHKKGHRVSVTVRVFPLRNTRKKIIGAIEIFSESQITQEEMASKIKELQKVALLDSLTELGNRRYAEATLSSKLNEMKRYGLSLGILFIDIDDFKKINDTYGHDVGDKVLKMVAKTLSGNIRPFDIATRWGGEEFVVFLLHVNKQQLFYIAHKLLKLVEHSGLFIRNKKICVTISIGAAIANIDDGVYTLIKKADKLMYQSKKSGKNRISITSGR